MLHRDYENYVGFKDHTKDRQILLDWKGARRTLSIFREPQKYREDMPAIYTLKEQDTEQYPSAYQIYMHSVDEYDAAIKIFGSYKHWKKLCNLKWFMEGQTLWNFEGIAEWRKTMKLRDSSVAKTVIYGKAKDGDLVAAKKLIDLSGKTLDLPKRDRPVRPDSEKKDSNDLGNDLANKIKELHSKIDK